MPRLLSLGLLLALPVLAPEAVTGLRAQTISHYHVDATLGDDTFAGTRSKPFKSITRAVAIATVDAVVHVRAGTYSTATTGEKFTIGLGTSGQSHQNVKILGADAATCILEFNSAAASAAYYLQVWRGAKDIEIANLTLQNGSNTPWYAAAVGIDCDGLHLHHCIIRNCVSGVIAWGGSRNSNIHDNLFSACGVALRYRQTTANGAKDNRFHQNLVVGNSGFHAISLSSGDPTQVLVNNIVFGSTGIGFDLGALGPGMIFQNNCAHSNATNYSSSGAISKSNLSVDPQFVDPSLGNYRLKSTSPCIETGYAAQPLVVNDFYGNARVSDFDTNFVARPDIGIHEISGLRLSVSNWAQGQTATLSLTSPRNILLTYIYLSVRPDSLVLSPFGSIGLDMTPGISYLIGTPTVPGSISLKIPTNPVLDDFPVWIQAFGLTTNLAFQPSGRLDLIQ